MAAGDVPTWLRRRTHQRVRTGSMYPTFPKGDGKDPKALSKQIVGTPGMFRYPNGIVLFGNRYFHHVLARGDIVVAENDVIRDISKTLRQVRRCRQTRHRHPRGYHPNPRRHRHPQRSTAKALYRPRAIDVWRHISARLSTTHHSSAQIFSWATIGKEAATRARTSGWWTKQISAGLSPQKPN